MKVARRITKKSELPKRPKTVRNLDGSKERPEPGPKCICAPFDYAAIGHSLTCPEHETSEPAYDPKAPLDPDWDAAFAGMGLDDPNQLPPPPPPERTVRDGVSPNVADAFRNAGQSLRTFVDAIGRLSVAAGNVTDRGAMRRLTEDQANQFLAPLRLASNDCPDCQGHGLVMGRASQGQEYPVPCGSPYCAMGAVNRALMLYRRNFRNQNQW